MSSCPKELERNGPTKGMTFTREQAEQLFQIYLQKKLSWFESGESGLNNLIFFIQCEDDPQRYVLKICGNAWNKFKTESEVSAMQIVHQYTHIPLPKIVAYSSNRNNEFAVEWIVMTRTAGKPLRSSSHEHDLWTKLSLEQKKSLINQLVEYVSQMHNSIPRSKLIGNYQLDGQIGVNCLGMGPWKNFLDFFNDRLKLQVKTLHEQSIFDPVRNDLLQLVEQFQNFNFPNFDYLSNVFTHYDLGVQNLLVSNDLQIQGIIDWEWAGSYPISEEYFRSYKPILYDEQLKDYLYDQLEQHHIPTPRTIPHFSLLKKMSDFLQTLVPWYLTDLANPEHPTVQKELDQIREKLNKLLQDIQQELQ